MVVCSEFGFAHSHDIHLIASYIGEDIPVTRNFFDVQMIAAQQRAKEEGDSSNLPGLKSCCSYFVEANGKHNGSWELDKSEQRSNWRHRPLTTSQLEYAGLDAAVLLVLLAEIVRRV